MKKSILTLAVLASLFSASPALLARDRDHDHDSDRSGSYDDSRSDVRKLWEWYGHLKDESNDHGSRHVRDRLDDIRESLRRVEAELHEGGRRDRIRDEISEIRDRLRRANEELHSGGDHRRGFSIQIR